MAVLMGIPVSILLVLIQTVVMGSIKLLSGTADVVLLALIAWAIHERVTTAWEWAIIFGVLVSLVSGLPFMIPLVGYLGITGIAQMLHRRIWQTPILAMFVVTALGTIIQHGLSIFALQFSGSPLDWQEALSLVTLPSMVLNLMLALPVYILITDLANWLHPVEIET